jgi:hypothetical protein
MPDKPPEPEAPAGAPPGKKAPPAKALAGDRGRMSYYYMLGVLLLLEFCYSSAVSCLS